MHKGCCKAESLCNILLATFTVSAAVPDMPCLGIASTFILPLHTMRIHVPLAAYIFP